MVIQSRFRGKVVSSAVREALPKRIPGCFVKNAGSTPAHIGMCFFGKDRFES